MHERISGGSEFKMADDAPNILRTPSRDLQADKENILPEQNMKTVKKLDSLSPFVRNGSKGFKILSDKEIAVVGNQSQLGKVKSSNQKRRSLATLQPSSDGKGKLAGNGRESVSIKEAFKRKKDSKHSSNSTKIDVKTSNEGSDSVAEKLTDTDDILVSQALDLMKKTEKVDDSYWKTIAEDRRDALEETLKENDKLYDEIDKLTEENEKLKQLLSDAECYKLLYTNLLSSQEHASSDD